MKEAEGFRHCVTHWCWGQDAAWPFKVCSSLCFCWRLKSSPQVQPYLPLLGGRLSFACCKALPMQIRWGADFGGAKLVVCK